MWSEPKQMFFVVVKVASMLVLTPLGIFEPRISKIRHGIPKEVAALSTT
ncbi:hypothetical protein SPYJRS4_1337 [Streptococcus pyogenes JRS4]|nr:hypothetical protein SPYJRS4_1337 [Streptococcus pyogenes JRS4]